VCACAKQRVLRVCVCVRACVCVWYIRKHTYMRNVRKNMRNVRKTIECVLLLQNVFSYYAYARTCASHARERCRRIMEMRRLLVRLCLHVYKCAHVCTRMYTQKKNARKSGWDATTSRTVEGKMSCTGTILLRNTKTHEKKKRGKRRRQKWVGLVHSSWETPKRTKKKWEKERRKQKWVGPVYSASETEYLVKYTVECHRNLQSAGWHRMCSLTIECVLWL